MFDFKTVAKMMVRKTMPVQEIKDAACAGLRRAPEARPLLLCVTAFTMISASSASAQFVFSGSGSGGTFDFDGDGSADGTWTISNMGPTGETVTFPAAGGVSFRFDNPADDSSGGWNLDSTFNAVPNDPEITYQLTIFGNNGSGDDFGSRFNDYTVNWAGGSSPATVNNPDSELAGITQGANSVNFQQPLNGGSGGAACIRGTGAIRNNCLDWSVVLPQGASNLNLVATGGARAEGFRYSLISLADISVSKSVSAPTILEGGSGSYTVTVENVGAIDLSAAVGTIILDPLPAGVTYTSHTINSDGNGTSTNTGGTYDSATGGWNVGKVSRGETITLTVNFTVDGGTAGSTITNTIDPADIRISQTDPNDNHGSLSASFVVRPDIDAVDDAPTTVSGSTGATTASVLDNDTLDGSVLDPADITLTSTGTASDGSTALGLDITPTAGSITMNAAGEIVVAPGTTAGSYVFTYEICETANPTNCDTAQATVAVDVGAINAIDDATTSASGSAGATTASVLGNDTLNGSVLDPADITLTSTGTASDGSTALGLDVVPAAGSITMNAAGEIVVASGTTAGIYVFTYQICEALNPTNCDIAQVRIDVENTSLLDLIRDDLETILEDDLSATLTQQSERMSEYASGALDRLRRRTGPACAAAVNDRLKQDKIHFDTDKAIIKPESNRILDEIAEILGTCEGSAFEIAGHTDSDASEEYNLRLSQRRVEAVQRALAERGVETDGFRARGYGESRPVASNATTAGKAANRRVEFVSLDDAEAHDTCTDGRTTTRSVDAAANGEIANIDGYFHSEAADCQRDAWAIVEGSLSYLETDNGVAQSMINLSYRRERFTDEDSIRGYFVGLYGAQNDVTNLATGEISGAGLNGGVYGADKFQNGLFIDYYLGAAAGQHRFDLDFDRSIGTINASGDYRYFAAFAGAALSGEVKLGKRTVSPRVGLDYAYSPGADVDVISELNGVRQSDSFELGSVSGGRVFVEVRDEYLINDGDTLFAFTPRLVCYQSIGGVDGACGFGGAIELTSVQDANDLFYSVELDGERGNGFAIWGISGSIAKQIRGGVLRANADLDQVGRLSLGGAVELQF